MERNNSLQLLVDYLLWLLVDSASSWKMSSSQIHVSPLFLSKNRSWQKTLGGNSRGTHVPKLSQKWISGPRPRLGQSRLITQPTLTYQNNYTASGTNILNFHVELVGSLGTNEGQLQLRSSDIMTKVSHYVMNPYATIRASCYEGGIGLKLICLYRLVNFAPDPCIGIATVSKFESSMDYSGGRSLGTPSCNDKIWHAIIGLGTGDWLTLMYWFFCVRF